MSDYTVLDIETRGTQPWDDPNWLVSVGIGLNVHAPERGRALARMLMARPGTTIVAHSNYDLRLLMLDGGHLAEGVHFHDTKGCAWLLDATQELDLDSLAQKYLGFSPPKLIRMRSKVVCFECADGSIVPIEKAPWDEVAAYNQSDCRTEAELYECLRALLQERGLWEHFINDKAPLSRLLLEMEVAGLPYDREAGGEMLEATAVRIEELRARLVEKTGAPDFNPGSGDQVARYLYEEVWEHPVKFAIPRLVGMTKEAKWEAVEAIKPAGVTLARVGREYAYGHLVLDGLGLEPPRVKKPRDAPEPKRPTVSGKLLGITHGDHAWVSGYIDYLKATKLAGYITSWQDKEHDGRLHGRVDWAGTVTGRLAGRDPNLQQVSTTGDVRGLFRGPMVVGDFGGLEARLAAHFSGDPLMLEVFRDGKDLYGVLAAQAWGGPATKENESRSVMKVVWLASQYGAQGETLARTMAVWGIRGYTARKADALLRDLTFAVPRLFEWRDEVIAEARALGYVTTLAGRRRNLPDLDSAVWKAMAKAERQAVNTKVQGSAADIVERVMLAARQAVDPERARIILQVHDEILWERMAGWEPGILDALRAICEDGHGFDLDVPLIFEAGVAESWADKGAPAPGEPDGHEHLAELATAA